MTQWVSFEEVKSQVSIENVLAHYGLLDTFRQKGDELIGLCPFHRETRGSFHASTTKNAFQCFGCKKHGNILDFVALKEEVSIREAALLLQGWFQIASEAPANGPVKAGRAKPHTAPPSPASYPRESSSDLRAEAGPVPPLPLPGTRSGQKHRGLLRAGFVLSGCDGRQDSHPHPQ